MRVGEGLDGAEKIKKNKMDVVCSSQHVSDKKSI
jgi:hypothetical protein